MAAPTLPRITQVQIAREQAAADADGLQPVAAIGLVLEDGFTAWAACGPDAAPGSCYAFRSPARYAKYYKAAGFDVMSTANNHAGDFGDVCRRRTEELLDQQGIAHSGRPGDVASLTVNGLKVAVIGFHTSQTSHYVNDHETAAALVRSLAAAHDIVVVSFHGGAEG
ncbi:MAG: CapA family protein, partial [Caldilineales bacterium]|nr:CapA family protein [Caldilineales bacterium]